MKPQLNANTRKLHDLGQRIWLDNITREMLHNGTLARYIAELSVTGLTSNPTIFEHAIGSGDLCDEAIQKLAANRLPCEDIFFELALQDLTQAADLFRPIFDASSGSDGWVSLEVSPLLANDTAGTIQAAARLHARAARPNLFIKIPGTPEGIPAIEQSIFDGVPVNVTLLFSREHCVAAAHAYLRGVERRIKAGLALHSSMTWRSSPVWTPSRTFSPARLTLDFEPPGYVGSGDVAIVGFHEAERWR